MSDNNYDITILSQGKGWKIQVSYWFYNRSKTNRCMTSETSYTWYTECKEIVELLQKRRTKVFSPKYG